MPQCGIWARETVEHAVRLHGRKRGWHLAAVLLGIKPDTARKIDTGATSGNAVCPQRAEEARLTMLRARLDRLRAEQQELENSLNAADMAGAVARLAVGR